MLEDGLASAFLLGELVHSNHEGRDSGVVRELLYVARHLLDEFVERLQVVGCRLLFVHILDLLAGLEPMRPKKRMYARQIAGST